MNQNNQSIKFVPIEFDPFVKGSFSCAVPATEPQKEIFASVLLGGAEANCSYNESISLRLTGSFHHAAMSAALQELINRHESLRACFSNDGNELLIYESLPVTIFEKDLSDASNEAQKNFIEKYISEEAAIPFNLFDGPLFRIALFKLAEEEHYLTFMAHHIISDGWSLGTILQDLSRLYTAYNRNEDAGLPEPLKYSEYAIEQQQFSSTKEFEAVEQYWVDQYKDHVPLLELPSDFPRPSLRTYKSRRDDYKIAPELIRSVRKIGAGAGCSFVTTFLIAFEVYLHRLTGQQSFVLGLPAAGQSATGNYDLVGHCVNLLPLRCEVNEKLTFRSFLEAQKSVVLDAYDHQLFTFGSLLKKIPVPRDASKVPLVPVVFNIDINLDKDVRFSDLKHELVSNPRVYENFEIFLNVLGTEEALTFEWSYNTQLFAPSTVKRMMDGFEYMLNAITENENLIIKDIPIADHEKTIDWQQQWNRTVCEYPKTKALHHLISEQALLTPDASALEYNGKIITYAQLELASGQLASLLKENGIQIGDTVALALDRSEKTIISLLAIVKAGAAYVPLDPDYPAERLQFMLEDSGAKILLTSRKYRGRFATKAIELIIEDIWPGLSEYKTIAKKGSGEDLAYILYTSGSTGKPKGVQIKHHSLINLLNATKKLLSVSREDRLLSVTTISFDISGLEMYLPLISGATVLIADDSTVKDGYLLINLIKSLQPTIMQATPSTWRMLFEAGWSDDIIIKSICCGGEALPRDLAKTLLTRCHSLFNMYGPTETTIWSTVKKVDRNAEIITIGRPIDNTTVYILDSNGNAVPENTVGEIYIGGDGLALGYLNRPELTQERFIDNPFSKNGEKLYRTGDLGRFLSNGEIQCLGRIDHQVKIRGHRIELEEIEHCLSKQKQIKQALVVAKERSSGDQRLIAYVTVHTSKENAGAEVVKTCKEYLKNFLPDYMIPGDFVVLDSFPLTPNGKIDRKLLPEPKSNQTKKESEFLYPRTDSEQMVARIWTELLGVHRISIQDSFFELGGHSLIAAQLMTRLEKETGHRLPLTEIFKFPTLEQFASLFAEDKPDPKVANDSHIAPKNESQLVYTSATESQIEIWLACVLGGEDANRSYNLSISEWLEGKLDYTSMTRTLQELIDRHESLRMTFTEDGKNICIHSSWALDLHYEDLTSYDSNAQQKFIDGFSKQNALAAFDLSKGPLHKIALFKLAEERHYLTFTVHHIICDGWSLGVLLQETSKLYSAYIKGEVPDLAEAASYSKYAVEQNEFLQSEEYKKTEQFWVDSFKDEVPVLNMPTDIPRGPNRTYKSRRDDYPFDKDLIEGIQKIGTQTGCSIAISLRAVFEIFLYRLTGQNDIILGLPAAGQLVTGNYNLVGHCVNLLPIRSKLTGTPSFIEYLKERKDAILNAYNHQQLTFGSLLKQLNIPRDPSRVPLVPIVFNIEMGMDDGVNFYGLKNTMVFHPREYETFDIFLNIGGTDAAPTLEWSYNTQLFTPAAIKQMMVDFEDLLKTIVNNPQINITDIILSRTENLYQQQQKWNNTETLYSKDKPLHYLITEQSNKTPTKLAVQCGEIKITYEELDKTSNQLAAFLIESGIQVGDTIGLALDRSEKTIISLLAVLKAGGVYVPLDPEYPKDRVEFMIEDSSAKLVLVSKKFKGQFATGAKEIIIEDVWKQLFNYSTSRLAVNVTGSNLAYILYTSGSTGKPKGVQIQHYNLVNFLTSMRRDLNISEEDRLLAVTTISFDISGMEIYLPLISGSTLLFTKTNTTKDAYLLLNAIQLLRPTIMQATPATWKMLLEASWTEDQSVHTICCGGEALSKDLASKLVKRSKALYNLYGPTETTIWSTIKKINPDEEIITIGRPINNTQIYILDEKKRPVAEGDIGEIYIGGDGLALGYLNRPELTQERFIDNPFSKNGEKLYRTGDLGRFLSNGEIQCLGRIDHQVKIRGHRIELEEIEHCLSKQKQIKQAVVTAREDNPGDQRLVAYIVVHAHVNNIKKYLATWKKELRSSLPSYMVPNDFVFLNRLPLTPNGKIDRKALPKPEPGINREVVQLASPQSKEEKIIAKIWTDLLGLAEVNIDDDFFELGGHSLIAVQMMARLEKETGSRLPLAILFECPTIRQLAVKLANDQVKTIPWNSLVPIKASGNKPPLYIVHGAGLNVMIFKSLAESMDIQQPVYGLQARGLKGEDKPLGTIEEIAAFYVSEITKHNPNGPYMLAGYSLGGIVAYEMARQLQTMGKEVQALVLFDTAAYVKPYGNFLQKAGRQLATYLKEQTYYLRLAMKKPRWALSHQREVFKIFIHRSYFKTKSKITGKESYFSHKYRIEKINDNALRNYQIAEYNGAIDLFRAKQQTFYLDDPEFLGWKPFALKGVKVHEIDAEHNRFFESPYDKELAKLLQQCLDQRSGFLRNEFLQDTKLSLIAV